jgi:four helix bundle protein
MAGRFQGDLPDRTLDFAVRIVNLTDNLPQNSKGWEVGKQLIRSGTSIGANVREADEAYSSNDFAYKCSLARKEASETEYWLKICERCLLLPSADLSAAMTEAHELACILSTIVKKTQVKQQPAASPSA